MNKEYKELKYLWLLVALLGTFWFVNDAKAQNNNIELIYPGKPAPIFSETNIAPEQKITKQITIRNNYLTPQDLGIQTLNISNSDFASVLILEISKNPILLSSPLANLAQPKETFITSILPGDTSLNLSLFLTKEAGNLYQDKKISFDIKFGFLKKEIEPTITPPVLGPAIRKLLPALLPTITPTEEEVEIPVEEKVLGEEAERPVQKPEISLPWWARILLLLLILLLIYLVYRQRRKRD